MTYKGWYAIKPNPTQPTNYTLILSQTPLVTLWWEKGTNTPTTVSFFVWYKFICYHPFLRVTRRVKQYENKSTALARQKETNHHWMIEAGSDLDIIWFAALVLWILRLLLQDHLAKHSGAGLPLRGAHPQTGAIIFPVFASLLLVSYWLPFLVFCLASSLMAFPFQVLPANQNPLLICSWYISIFNLGVHWYPDIDVSNTPIHLPICFSLIAFLSLSLSLSLCFCDCLESHICSFFSPLL